jgi:taurine dioxygenase
VQRPRRTPIENCRFGPRPYLRAESERLSQVQYQQLEIAPLSPTIGAEIRGVDLAQLDDATFKEIHRAHLDWKVIFLRDQDITVEQHVAFARRFGELEVHPFLPEGGAPEVVRFAKDDKVPGFENGWHSDVSWREIPSMGSVLRAREVPAIGGDTLFSDMYAAYEGLGDEVKARIDGRVAVHDFTQSFGRAMKPEDLERQQREYPPVEHPIVRTHAETGRKALYVNAFFTSHVPGLSSDESLALLDLLTRQAHVPEYQCRFHWAKDSIALWDNRAVQHYANSDYFPRQRVMERVTIIGERPA